MTAISQGRLLVVVVALEVPLACGSKASHKDASVPVGECRAQVVADTCNSGACGADDTCAPRYEDQLLRAPSDPERSSECHAQTCSGFYVWSSVLQGWGDWVLCVYDPQGALVFIQGCTDYPALCNKTSACGSCGTWVDPWANCPSDGGTSDGGRDGG